MKINVYKAPLVKMTATNFKTKKGILTYDKNTEIIDENVLLYYNIFGTIVTVDNNFPVITDEEIGDLIQDAYTRGLLTEKSKYCQSFVDTSKLEFVKQEKKKIKLLKR